MVGRQVFEEQDIQVDNHLIKQVNLASLPEGIYFVRVSGKQILSASKLIIKK
jgi:hypothetical protein